MTSRRCALSRDIRRWIGHMASAEGVERIGPARLEDTQKPIVPERSSRSRANQGSSEAELRSRHRLCDDVFRKFLTSDDPRLRRPVPGQGGRSEEHTAELQSLIRNSSAVFCVKKKKHK